MAVTKRDIVIYVRMEAGRSRVVDSDNIAVNTTAIPVFYYGEQATVKLRPLTAAGVAWTKTEMDVQSSWTFAVDDDFDRSTTPAILSDSGFTTYEYDTDPSCGELRCDIDGLTNEYSDIIKILESVNGWAQWHFLSGTDILTTIQIPVVMRGSIIDPGDDPPGSVTLYTLVSNNPPIHGSDPTGDDLREGLLWFNSTDYVLRLYANSTTYNIVMTPKP